MLQLMQPFPYRVFSLNQTIACILLVDILSKLAIFLAGIASLSGYDDFDAVTAEDMAMEVIENENTLQFFPVKPKNTPTHAHYSSKIKLSYTVQGLLFPSSLYIEFQVLKEIEKLTRVKKMMEEAGKPF